MKTPILLSLAVFVTLSLGVSTAETLLSPRAKGAQSKTVATAIEPSATFNQGAAVSPRTLDTRIITVAGTSADAKVLACPRHAAASPKCVATCAEHPGAPMSCCSSVAGAK